MSLLEELACNPHSVTDLLEKYSGEEIEYSAIANSALYNLTPNEMIALNTRETIAHKRYGFLRGQYSGKVFAKVESKTLARPLGLNMNNHIPLGKLLKPYNHTRHNLYAKPVSETDEAGNDIVFRITALLSIKDQPVALVREWIYG